MIALAPGGGGAYTYARAAGHDRAPAARARGDRALLPLRARARRGALARRRSPRPAMDLAFVHPTYALFLAIPLVGFALVRALAARRRPARERRARSSRSALPVLLVFALARADRRRDASRTARTRPSGRAGSSTYAHRPRRALADELPPRARASSRAPARSRSPRSCSSPLAAFAARRRWSAFVLGGTVLVLALELLAVRRSRTSPTSSRSRSRGAPRASSRSRSRSPAAPRCSRARCGVLRAAGRARGRDRARSSSTRATSARGSRTAGPPLATWIALCGGLAGIVAAIVLARRARALRAAGWLRRRWPRSSSSCPVAVHGFAHWDAAAHRDAYALTPGLVAVPPRARAGARRRLRRPRDELPDLGVRAGLRRERRRRRTSPTRRRTTRTARRADLLALPRAPATSRSRARYGARLARAARRTSGSGRAPRLVYRDGRFRVYRL